MRRSIVEITDAVDARVGRSDILSPSRRRSIVYARQRAMLEAWLQGWSISAIGREMGRDRATVLHGIRRAIKRLQATDQRRARAYPHTADDLSHVKHPPPRSGRLEVIL